MKNSHSIEPELQGQVPRRVKRRKTSFFSTWTGQLCLSPFWVLCLGMLFWFGNAVLVRTAGRSITVPIVNREQKFYDGKQRYYLFYRVTLASKSFTVQEMVDKSSFEHTPPGSSAQLLVSPLWPGANSALLLPGRSIWGDVWIIGIGNLVMLGLAALMVLYVYILPIRRRWLVIWGTAVPGRIIDKTTLSVEAVSSTQSQALDYEYLLENDLSKQPRRFTSRQYVEADEWEQVEDGDCFTVLYHPKRPQVSALYAFGDYEAI